MMQIIKTKNEAVKDYPYQLLQWQETMAAILLAYEQIIQDEPDYCVIVQLGDKWSVFTKGKYLRNFQGDIREIKDEPVRRLPAERGDNDASPVDIPSNGLAV